MKLILLVCLLLVVGTNALRNWDYTFISIEYDLKADYTHADVEVKRKQRNEYALNGSFTVDKDLGPKFMVRFYSYCVPS